MLTLSLLRHAKSSWGDATLKDFDRPLNDRGREAAPLMGTRMRREGLTPDHIVCSPSLRTRQTLALVQDAHPVLGLQPTEFQDRLYHARPVTILRAIHEAPEAARHLLLIGHNPGLQQLAVWLIGKGADSKRQQLRQKLPTGALIVMTINVDRWRDVTPGGGGRPADRFFLS